MPTFFFDIDDGSRLIRDDLGTVLPSEQAAKQEALAILPFLASYRRHAGATDLVCQVRNEAGTRIITTRPTLAIIERLPAGSSCGRATGNLLSPEPRDKCCHDGAKSDECTREEGAKDGQISDFVVLGNERLRATKRAGFVAVTARARVGPQLFRGRYKQDKSAQKERSVLSLFSHYLA